MPIPLIDELYGVRLNALKEKLNTAQMSMEWLEGLSDENFFTLAGYLKFGGNRETITVRIVTTICHGDYFPQEKEA